MESNLCSVCLKQLKQQEMVKLQTCHHLTCSQCIIKYIATLKKYKQLTPKRLKCLTESCKQQIDDKTISKLFPGQQGFILNIIKRKYKQSLNPSIKIFSCVGFTKNNLKPLIDKPINMTRQEHSQLTNPYVRDIINAKIIVEDKINCRNIISFNPSQITKDKYIQCYICGITYCLKCMNITHKEQQCQIVTKSQLPNQLNVSESNETFQQYITTNKMIRCLNSRCGVVIAKQQGCFWVKCRCSWQFCYPCEKLWGDCQHFSKYPYQKFVPPPQWMVKALNLY